MPEREIQKIQTDRALDLIEATSQMMPNGQPDFSLVSRYVKLNALYMTEGIGKGTILMVILEMLKSFCENINVKEKLTTAQGMRIASFLCDDCQGMSLEDYQMMFSLAERGKLGKIYGRIDIEVIGNFKEAYLDYMFDLGRKWKAGESKRQSERLREQKRLEYEQQKLLGSPDVIPMDAEQLAAEFKKLTDSLKQNEQKFLVDEDKQLEIRAKIIENRLQSLFGMPIEAVKELRKEQAEIIAKQYQKQAKAHEQ